MRLVPIECIKEGSFLARTIFDENGRTLLKEGIKLNTALIKRIKSINIFSLYIIDEYSYSDIEDVIKPELRQKSIKIVKDTFSNIERIANYIFDSSTSSKDKNLLIKERECYLKNICDVALELIENISANKNILVNLVDIKSMDNYTYQHCVNVAVLSLVMGVALKLPRSDLQDLCIGALIHDIGKVCIPKEIILKDAELTEQEFNIIKTHPQKGYDYIGSTTELSSVAKMIILQHHEKEDGTGYPFGLTGNEVNPLVKIVAIADVYDALTSDRPYKKAATPNEALEYIMANVGTHFDINYVDLFTKIIVPFPTGTVVKLSNGEIGVVEETPPNYPLRPSIKILKSPLNENRVGSIINLLKDLSLVISGIQYEV
ncbi:HD-GYP domain-containing protein [Clostridium sp. 'White wine YQ']|uniref:HD-GYP domain-containing protein n=1 Tax=Clostridium sp. 'White wine YQ' TaxID=3027474 RepID=UPI002365D6B4|nr:HD-GYP domain-containing protein [Clostridium sp. 'White wine YQ']MDD7795141.1 HD-GYP domain-containing protein [Clostridium sp. 'White wine YQ']